MFVFTELLKGGYTKLYFFFFMFWLVLGFRENHEYGVNLAAAISMVSYTYIVMHLVLTN